MRTIFNMVRVPNLLIIALTFFIIRYLVFIPVYARYSIVSGIGNLQYSILIIITALIAAAGYIANDYFDVLTDRVNKPEKQYIGKQITPGSALATAILFSILVIVMSIWLSANLRSWLPGTLLLFALVAAWWYAIQLKKSFLLGNLAVASMSAGTIVMAWLIENQVSGLPEVAAGIITSVVVAISIFAFLLSLMREIIKDIEDVEGDQLIHCRSLPIVKDIPYTKAIVFVITVITLLLLILAQGYLMYSSEIIASVWLLIFVEVPLIFFGWALKKAKEKVDYHKLSSLLKWIMLGGIGSIVAGQF